MTRRNRQLDTLSDRIYRAAAIVPEVLDHLDEQRANISAIHAHPTDAGGNSHGDHGDPTLGTVLQFDPIEHHRRTVLDAIATLGVCVDMLDRSCRDALGARGQRLVPACIVEGCNQIPDLRVNRHTGQRVDDGRCIDCGREWDELQAQRKREANERRARRYGQSENFGDSGQSSQVDG